MNKAPTRGGFSWPNGTRPLRGGICADVQKNLNPCTNLKTVNHYDNNKHVTEVTRKGIRKITTFSLQHVGTFHLPDGRIKCNTK
jgi:hypothetical protein